MSPRLARLEAGLPFELLDLTGQITREGQYPSAHGGFADVWKGYWESESKIRKVAIKVLRSYSIEEEDRRKLNKRLRRELRVWRRLNHKNVIQLYGVVSDFGPQTSMVCPWFENGNVNSYLESCGTGMPLSERLRILMEVAAGLSYLHSCHVVHGDLTGSNILVGNEGQICLSDFGLSTIIADFQGNSFTSTVGGGSIRWAAPELYRIHNDNHVVPITAYSDIYSFGSVMLQILSGRIPYHYLRTDAQVIIEMHKGIHPRRPIEPQHRIADDHWLVIEQCWADVPERRPYVQCVYTEIQHFHQECQSARVQAKSSASSSQTSVLELGEDKSWFEAIAQPGTSLLHTLCSPSPENDVKSYNQRGTLIEAHKRIPKALEYKSSHLVHKYQTLRVKDSRKGYGPIPSLREINELFDEAAHLSSSSKLDQIPLAWPSFADR